MKSVSNALLAMFFAAGIVACGDKPADPAASNTQAPVAVEAGKSADAKPAAKADGPNPLEHEGIPGMSDMFSKKKEDH